MSLRGNSRRQHNTRTRALTRTHTHTVNALYPTRTTISLRHGISLRRIFNITHGLPNASVFFPNVPQYLRVSPGGLFAENPPFRTPRAKFTRLVQTPLVSRPRSNHCAGKYATSLQHRHSLFRMTCFTRNFRSSKTALCKSWTRSLPWRRQSPKTLQTQNHGKYSINPGAHK